jgi:RHS repeat-associated protein
VKNRWYPVAKSHARVEWDFEDRLVRVVKGDGTVVENVYDVDGVLVSTVVTPAGGNAQVNDLLVDTSGGLSHVIAEIDGNGSVTALYVRAGDMLLEEIRGGMAKMYEADGLGSVRGLLDVSGARTDTYAYEAFGSTVSSTGTDGNPYRFAGERLVGDVGMYQNRARWLDTRVGTFVSVDPMVDETGMPYVYGNGNPVSMADPTGEMTLPQIGATLVMSSILGGVSGAAYGAIRNGVDGALTYGVQGLWMGPLIAAGVMSGGAAFGAAAGVSEAWGMAIVGSAVNGYFMGESVNAFLDARTDRERAASIFSFAMGVAAQGYATYGMNARASGRGTYLNEDPRASAQEIAAGKLAADYFKIDIVQKVAVGNVPGGPQGVRTPDLKLILKGKTMEVKGAKDSQSLGGVASRAASAQSDNVILIVRPGQLSNADCLSLSRRLFSRNAPSPKTSLWILEDFGDAFKVLYGDRYDPKR